MQMKLNVPWFVVGDFNTVLSSSKKKGGRFPRHLYMEEFRDCLLRCSLFDAGFVGSSFTWCNNQHGEGRILARLDRCLVNDSGFDLQLQVSHMARFNSDHSPLLLCITKPNVDGPRPFKFLDVWLENGGCLSVIKNSWVASVCDEGDMSFR